MKYEPPLDSVIVEREIVTKSEEGLELPKSAWAAKWFGKIIAVGPGMLRTMPLPQTSTFQYTPGDPIPDFDRYPMQYAVGDFVICPPGMQPFPEEVPIKRNSNTRLFVCSERQLISKIVFEDGDDKPACNNGDCKCKR